MELLSPKTIRAQKGGAREEARGRNEKLASEEKRLVTSINDLKLIEKDQRKKTADAIAANEASLAVKQTVLAKEVGALEARKAEAMKPVDEKLLEAKQLIADNKLQLEAIEISRAELETTKQKILELDSALKNKESEIDRRNETLDRREKAISAGENEIKRLTDDLANRWVEYNEQVHKLDEKTAFVEKRQNELASVDSAQGIRHLEQDKRDKELQNGQIALKDAYAALAQAKKHLGIV
jgi:hypothetical protein